VSRMYEWFIGPPGHDHVQFVGRQENLIEDLIDVLTILGYEIDVRAIHGIARANESQKRRGEPVWDPDLRRKVMELEAPAIRRFYTDGPEPRSRAVARALSPAEKAASPTPFRSPRDGSISSRTPLPTEQELRIAVSHPGASGPVEESTREDRLKPHRHVAADDRMGWRRADIVRRIGQCLRGR